MDKCREEFEKWREPQDIGTQWWTIWQAAWNGRQPEAKPPTVGYSREQMEDALRHFIGPFRSIDIEYYMNSLTTTAADPVPTVDELAEAMYQDNTALLTNVEARYIAKVVHKLLTKSRGGA